MIDNKNNKDKSKEANPDSKNVVKKTVVTDGTTAVPKSNVGPSTTRDGTRPNRPRPNLRRVGGVGIRSKFPISRPTDPKLSTTVRSPQTSDPRSASGSPTGPSSSARPARHGGYQNRQRTGHRDRNRTENKEEDNYVSHILLTKRCTKVVSNGKNMRFYVLSVVGDKKRSVGLGQGKARTIVGAINKSFSDARKNMIMVKDIFNIKHKFKSTVLILKKNHDNQIITSNAFYNIFNAAGITGVSCKILVSRNIMNAAKCLFECFKESNERVLKSANKESIKIS